MFELIIISWMLPNVPVSVVKIEIGSQKACEIQLEKRDIIFKKFKSKDDRFNYGLECLLNPRKKRS